MLFRSGMAAITAFLQNVRPHLFNEDHEPIILDFFGGYFESKRLFDLFSSPLFSFRRHASQDQLLQAIEKSEGQLLFLEPVAYDWEMEALNLDKLHTALASRKQMPRMIVLDTTIIGDTFPMKQFLSSLPGKPRRFGVGKRRNCKCVLVEGRDRTKRSCIDPFQKDASKS
jgi:cystathionine beta-lyase/cystathionine gamma-synthase